MAGQPKTRKAVEALRRIGEEEILEAVLDGITVRQLIVLYDTTQSGFYKWLDEEPGRRARFTQAREAYAEQLDAEGLNIADGVEEDKDAIAKAKLRIDQRKHVAAQRDRSRHDPSGGAGVNITLTVAELHLEAVREEGIQAGELRVLREENAVVTRTEEESDV